MLLGGCVVGLGMTAAGNPSGGDNFGGGIVFVALGLFLGGVALKRHVRVAERPTQTIALSRLLSDPSFTAYAFDNARAKVLDEEIRDALARLKDGLLVNRDLREAESFEL